MSNAKPITVNATFMWPFLTEVNGMSGKYQVDLSELSPAAVEALEMMGIPVRNKADRGDYITAKSTHPIRVYDTDSNEIKGVSDMVEYEAKEGSVDVTTDMLDEAL